MVTVNSAIPGVKRIYAIDASKLQPLLMEKSLAEIPIRIFAERLRLPFFGYPTCRTTTSLIDNEYRDTTKFKFETTVNLPIRTKRLAFAIEDVTGGKWLLGVKESPILHIEKEKGFGIPGSEARTIIYTISHNARKTLLEADW